MRGSVCGIPLPHGLKESDRLPEPIFTPATKAQSGHDENISFDTMVGLIGTELAERLSRLTLAIYQTAAEYAPGPWHHHRGHEIRVRLRGWRADSRG